MRDIGTFSDTIRDVECISVNGLYESSVILCVGQRVRNVIYLLPCLSKGRSKRRVKKLNNEELFETINYIHIFVKYLFVNT